jgi:hypothetical protein
MECIGGVLDCLGEILNWSFRTSRGHTLSSSLHVSMPPTTVRPGKTWQDVLLSPTLIDTVFEACTSLRHLHKTDLPLRTRQILIQVHGVAPCCAACTLLCLTAPVLVCAAVLPFRRLVPHGRRSLGVLPSHVHRPAGAAEVFAREHGFQPGVGHCIACARRRRAGSCCRERDVGHLSGACHSCLECLECLECVRFEARDPVDAQPCTQFRPSTAWALTSLSA